MQKKKKRKNYQSQSLIYLTVPVFQILNRLYLKKGRILRSSFCEDSLSRQSDYNGSCFQYFSGARTYPAATQHVNIMHEKIFIKNKHENYPI